MNLRLSRIIILAVYSVVLVAGARVYTMYTAGAFSTSKDSAVENSARITSVDDVSRLIKIHSANSPHKPQMPLSAYSTPAESNPPDKAEAVPPILAEEKENRNDAKVTDRKTRNAIPSETSEVIKALEELTSKRDISINSEEYIRALEALNSVLLRVPFHMDTNQILARSRLERNKTVDRHLKKGIHYFLDEEMEAAIKLWDAVLKLDPDNKAAVDYKNRAKMIMERYEEIKKKQ